MPSQNQAPFDNADLDQIGAATDIVVGLGMRIFQTHLLAKTELEHVEALLTILDPPKYSMILDAGCGIGEVARIMSKIRPDIDFILANVCAPQLSMCPVGTNFHLLEADCHKLSLPDDYVNAVMFSSSICHMCIPVALKEASRVTEPGGSLLITDMAREKGTNEEFIKQLNAHAFSKEQVIEWAEAAGYELEYCIQPDADASHFEALFEDIQLYKGIFGDLKYTIWKFRKLNESNSSEN